MESEERFVDSQAKVARAIGVDRHTIKEWMGEGAPGKTSQGYDVQAITEWRELNKRTPIVIGDAEFEIRMANAKLRKLEGEALKAESEGQIKEHEVKKTTQDVVHLDDVEQFLSLHFGETRRVLMRIPTDMKNGYPENMRQDLEDDIKSRLEIALRTISGNARRLADVREGG